MFLDLAVWSDGLRYSSAVIRRVVFPVPLQRVDACQMLKLLWQAGVAKYVWAPERK